MWSKSLETLNPYEALKSDDNKEVKEIKPMTLRNRIKNAIRAFRGKPIQTLCLGVAVKQCDECEYAQNYPLRPIKAAYDILVAYRDADMIPDMGTIEELIGYLGEALELGQLKRIIL